jgi:hypothetical protein
LVVTSPPVLHTYVHPNFRVATSGGSRVTSQPPCFSLVFAVHTCSVFRHDKAIMLALTTACGRAQSAFRRKRHDHRSSCIMSHRNAPKDPSRASSPRSRQSPTNHDLYFFLTHTPHAGVHMSGASRRGTPDTPEEWILWSASTTLKLSGS